MSSSFTKSKIGYLAELHCHTRNSFDAYTSENELLRECLKKEISLIAVSEHDKISQLNIEKFKQYGVFLIPACEFTCSKGAHIIGLFVNKPLDKGSPIELVFSHIIDQQGLILIPHPFKAGSGYFDHHSESSLLNNVSFMEIHNGAWDNTLYKEEILKISKSYNIRLVGASDAHKPHHVGFIVTAFKNIDFDNIRQSLLESPLEIYRNTNILGRIRQPTSIQKKKIYQFLIQLLPYHIKRLFKIIHYAIEYRNYNPTAATYRLIEE